VFLTDSTSDNSGHTATLRSAQIWQSRTSYVPENVIRKGGLRGR